MLRIFPVSLASPDARELERQHSIEMTTRYGGEEPEEPLDSGQFEPPGGCFAVAFLEVDGGDRMAVGCGGIRRHDADTAELKRMFVVPEARGQGIARALLERLEEEAMALGYLTMWLETGTAQPEAISLYESHGYEPIAGFGRYKDEPRSRSFGRSLNPP